MTPLAYAKWIGIAIVALLLFFGARSCGSAAADSRRAREMADMQQTIAAKNRALRENARAFRAFANTFRAISAITDQQLVEARRRAALATEIGYAEAAARTAAEKRAATFAQLLAEAKQRKPGCKALLETDLAATCGVTLR